MAKKITEKKKTKKVEEETKKKIKTKKKDVVKKIAKEDSTGENIKIKEENILDEKEVLKKEKPKSLKKDFISGTGRRKTSVASVFLWQDKGDFIVNGMLLEDYFPSDVDKTKWARPFHAIGVSHPEAKYSASIKVSGSGKPSQLDAVVLGISRALAKIDEEFDKILRKQGFMTRDSRMVERKKPYLHKARKRPQYSKR